MDTVFVNLEGVNTITPGRRIVYTVIGTLFVLMSIFLILNAALEKNYDISLLSPAVNFIVGLWFFLTGVGVINKQIKQYLKIDGKQIEYKPSALRFPQIIKLDKITGFKIDKSLISCITAGKTIDIDLSRASGRDVKQIKETIKEVADNRMIEVRE